MSASENKRVTLPLLPLRDYAETEGERRGRAAAAPAHRLPGHAGGEEEGEGEGGGRTEERRDGKRGEARTKGSRRNL